MWKRGIFELHTGQEVFIIEAISKDGAYGILGTFYPAKDGGEDILAFSMMPTREGAEQLKLIIDEEEPDLRPRIVRFIREREV